MTDLVLAAADIDVIRRELTGGAVEACAILYANQTTRADGTVRLLARDVQLPGASDYSRRGLLEAELNPEFVARVTKRARRDGCALVFVHSHPGLHAPVFSDIDARGEDRLARFLSHRHPGFAHAALVVSLGGVRARGLGTDEEIGVVGIGANRDVVFDPLGGGTGEYGSEAFDRQIRAFGAAGQQRLQGLRIAVVGLGGVGSLVAQQLVHLGVRDFILVDPDTLEPSNLNRVSNATPQTLGEPKVEIAARYICGVAGNAAVARVQGDVTRASVARELLNADIVFGCTDSHGSRAVLQQVSYQYMIPCIDTGTTIAVTDGSITHIYGRVQLLSPGLACFTCSGLLDPGEVRRDMMTPFERQADPYVQGAREPAPAVMSLNGTVASMAVTMLLSMVCGVPVKARYILYDAISSTLRTVRATPVAGCYICSGSGSFARGDSWPLLGRQD